MNKGQKFPSKINGILYKTEEEYNDRLQSDIDALAQLIYDIYQDKKQSVKIND